MECDVNNDDWRMCTGMYISTPAIELNEDKDEEILAPISHYRPSTHSPFSLFCRYRSVDGLDLGGYGMYLLRPLRQNSACLR